MKKKWVSTDGWRGYYEPIAPKGWELLLTCSVVNEAGKQLRGMLVKWLKERKVKHRSGFLRTSNIFSASFYMLVEANKLSKAIKEELENWFINNNNSTFSIFSGESYELDTNKAEAELKIV